MTWMYDTRKIRGYVFVNQHDCFINYTKSMQLYD